MYIHTFIHTYIHTYIHVYVYGGKPQAPCPNRLLEPMYPRANTTRLLTHPHPPVSIHMYQYEHTNAAVCGHICTSMQAHMCQYEDT